jgi:osmoprotectant transport system substrate-binding protein
VALDDDKHLFAAQNIVPVIAKSSLTDTVEKTLDAISAKLTTGDLITLNEDVLNGQSFQKVATDWLKSKGLK